MNNEISLKVQNMYQNLWSHTVYVFPLYSFVTWEWLTVAEICRYLNPLAPESFVLNLAHPVYKMWIIQESNKLALWNKLHFEEKKTESIERV